MWTAQLTSNIGDQFYSIALLWYLLQQTGSSAALSLITIPDMVAGFLFYLIGGVLADRCQPRKLMVGADLARLFIVAAIGLMVYFSDVPFPFFFFAQFLLGIFSTLFQPAKTVALKAMVLPEQLSEANAILDSTFRTVRILAPMSIGVLGGLVPLAGLFFINTFSYLLSALLIRSLGNDKPQTDASLSAPQNAAAYWRDIAKSFADLRSNRLLFSILLYANMGYLFWMVCWSAGLPTLAKQIGGGDPGTLGLLIGSYGIGNLVSSLFMTRFSYRQHLLVILCGWLAQAVGFVTLGLADGFILFAAAAVAGIGGPLTGIPTVTAIQTMVQPTNTGKIFSVNMLAQNGFGVLSSLLGAVWFGTWQVHTLFWQTDCCCWQW
nr:MFS transporter [Brevibacillus fulvus]